MNYDALFNSIAREPSINKKIEMLKEHKDDALLKEIVRLTLDPFTNFYIRKIPRYHTTFGTLSLSDAVDSLKNLSNRVYTGNAAIAWLMDTLELLRSFDARVIECIINRDLACGVSIGIANKVWPKLISKYPVMLCSTRTDKLVNAITFPAIVQKKEDGMRFNAIVVNGKVTLVSKTGRELFIENNFDFLFNKMADGQNVVYDGELLVVDENRVALDRKTGNGILSKAIKEPVVLYDRCNAILWDRIPHDDFIKGKCTVPYKDRFETLEGEVDRANFLGVSVVSTSYAYDIASVERAFRRHVEEGFEGIILKDRNSIWEPKRSTKLIKFKGENECDLRCIDVVDGKGRSLTCQSEDGLLVVGVGVLAEVQENLDPKEFLDKIITVKYNARIENKAGKQSLFLPVFVEVRTDKDVADSLKDIV